MVFLFYLFSVFTRPLWLVFIGFMPNFTRLPLGFGVSWNLQLRCLGYFVGKVYICSSKPWNGVLNSCCFTLEWCIKQLHLDLGMVYILIIDKAYAQKDLPRLALMEREKKPKGSFPDRRS